MNILSDETVIDLVKKLNTRDSIQSFCKALLHHQKDSSSTEDEMLLRAKAVIERAFRTKGLPEYLVNEYTSIVHSMIKKEIPLQRAFIALE